MRRFLLNKRLLSGIAGAIVLAWPLVAFLQSGKPELPPLHEEPQAPVGVPTVEMIERLMVVQLESAGGWVPNDLPLSPSYVLDNLPNFQLGVLQVVRHASRVLRDNLTRQRTSDAVHPDTDTAYSAYANDPYRWAFPSAEGAFSRGNAALEHFKGELGAAANFYPRADNLVQLLEPFVSELGAVTTLLLEAGDSEKFSWFDIDDNFYYAQGVGFALLGLVQAMQQDFRKVLEDKNAVEITGLIVASLRESQFEPWIVTNGSKGGLLANHSSNLKAFLDDARQKMNSLITILKQG